MLPDLRGFVRGIHRELLTHAEQSEQFQTAGGIKTYADISMAYLLVNLGEGPAIVAAYEHATIATLEDLLSILARAGVEPDAVAGAQKSLAACSSNPTMPLQPYERTLRLAAVAEQCAGLARVMPRDQEKGATLVGRLVDAEEQLRGAWSAAVSHQVTVLNSNRRSLREKGVRAEPLEAYFRSLYRDRPELRVEALRLLPGAHSREVYFFDLIDSTGRREPVVLRRDREQNAVPTTVAEERPIMETLRRRGFPVPEVLAASEDNRILGRPFLAMRRLAGQELAQRSDLARYAAAAARLLAQLHQVPLDGLALPLRLLSPPLETAWPRLIEERFAIWRRFKPSSSVIMQHAYGWLQDHCQAVSSRFSCVHGDFQPQNLIVDDDQVVGLLDFEVCHLGHPAEDLLAIRSRIEAHVPWRDFFDVYLEQGGAPVSPAELSFCSVWVPFFYATIAATAYDTFLHHAGFDISTGAPAIMHLPPLLQMLTGALQAANTP